MPKRDEPLPVHGLDHHLEIASVRLEAEGRGVELALRTGCALALGEQAVDISDRVRLQSR